jgi:hypothetical protein
VTVRIPQVLALADSASDFNPIYKSPIKIANNFTSKNKQIEDKISTTMKPFHFNLKFYQNHPIINSAAAAVTFSKTNLTFTKNKPKTYLVKSPNRTIIVKKKNQRLIRSSSVTNSVSSDVGVGTETSFLGRILSPPPVNKKHYRRKSDMVKKKKINNRSLTFDDHQLLLQDVEKTIGGHNKVLSISVDAQKRAE